MKWCPLLVLLLFSQESGHAPTAQPPKPFHSPDGECTIQFPDEHWQERQGIGTSRGRLLLYRWYSQPDGNGRVIFMLGWHALPKNVIRNTPPTALLGRLRDGLLTSTKGELISEEPRWVRGYRGQEYHVAGTAGLHVRAQFFLVKDRVYQLLVVGTAADTDSTRARNFFQSFVIHQ